VRSYLAVPVISRSGEVLGGLFFGHPDTGVFGARSERLIVGIARQAAIAIDNARLYDDVRQLAEEREQLLIAERAARAEMQRVNLLKEEFLANLSHELRTPLNAILGWSQLIATGRVGPEDLEQGMDTIARNARAQAQLIDDLLDMSRIVSGKVRLDVQETDLALAVQQAVNTVRPSAEAKGIRLRQIVDPLVGSVSGDPNRLQQVVWNLLSNSVKFTPKGGRIDVILQRVNSHVEITVNDSGAGIPADFLPHLFERFRQLDASATRTSGGLGLGLSIVKQLVELHGGSVRAHSEGEGTGATFTVSLPLAPVRQERREHPTTPTRQPELDPPVDLAGLRVLVVEDEADARHLIKRVLMQARAEVITASTAAEGLQLLGQQQPHVLISDIGMPGMDGYQFIRKVRRRSPDRGGQVPAIALTAFARSEDRTRAMMAGYQMHIAKPIEPQELVATVANVAGRTAPPADELDE
jgi:signal transduction histidine kinase/ActR/RegA family two-component response regulator